MLVSRVYRFGPSPRSRSTSTHSLARDSGVSGEVLASSGSNVFGEKSSTSGSSSGSIDSGSATGRPVSSYTIGNGSPQYRCRLNSQSRSRNVTAPSPWPSRSSHSMIVALASATSRPSRKDELMAGPSPRYALPSKPSAGCTVRTIGRSKTSANSQSRSS